MAMSDDEYRGRGFLPEALFHQLLLLLPDRGVAVPDRIGAEKGVWNKEHIHQPPIGVWLPSCWFLLG